jgi:hypothetical protein
MAASKATSAIRDRVVGFERIPGKSIRPHVKNWREHPGAQKDALRGVMDAVGIADTLVVYRSPRNGGEITLIDGHLRQEDYRNVEWPCVILDVDDEEADLLLASHDPLAAMAKSDQDKLDDLINDVRQMDVPDALDDLFTKLHSAEPDDAADDEDRQDQPATQFIVLVTCADETAQASLLERLSGEGYEVKALMT